jgi:hypothetical protein
MIRFRMGIAESIRTFVLVIAPMCVIRDAHAESKESVLYSSKGGSDGSNTVACVILNSVGNLYGTTYKGVADNFSTIFKLAGNVSESVPQAFNGGNRDGERPYAGAISDKSGNLYGTTVGGGVHRCYYGGPTGCGTVFRVASVGTESVLYLPEAGLIDVNGMLYGTISCGGIGRCKDGGGTDFPVNAATAFSGRRLAPGRWRYDWGSSCCQFWAKSKNGTPHSLS